MRSATFFSRQGNFFSFNLKKRVKYCEFGSSPIGICRDILQVNLKGGPQFFIQTSRQSDFPGTTLLISETLFSIAIEFLIEGVHYINFL